MDSGKTQNLALTTSVYLGNVEGQSFVQMVDWCLEKFGTYGERWRLDWDRHTIYLDDHNAVLFALKWAE